jgi:hypothetical protein
LLRIDPSKALVRMMSVTQDRAGQALHFTQFSLAVAVVVVVAAPAAVDDAAAHHRHHELGVLHRQQLTTTTIGWSETCWRVSTV